MTLTKGGGSSTITTVSGATNGSGQATFTVKDTVAEATTYTATDTTDSVTVTQTASVTFTPGTPTAAQSTVVGSARQRRRRRLDHLDGHGDVEGRAVAIRCRGRRSRWPSRVAPRRSPPSPGSRNGSGQATFTVKDAAVESTTYTATDTTDSVTVTQTASVSFTAGAVDATSSTVAAAPASRLANGVASSTITVTAKDAFAHPLAGQTVTLAQGAGSSTITVVSGTSNGSGVATFTVTDTLAQAVTYTATIGVTPILQTATVTYTPGPASHFTVSAPASSSAGSPFSVTLTALDANNNTATAYTGTVHFTSNDGQAVLPANYTFTGADNGSHTFTNATTLKTAGSKTLVATDTVTGSITGSSNVTVNPAAANAAASTLTATPSHDRRRRHNHQHPHRHHHRRLQQPPRRQNRHPRQGSGNSTITTISGVTNASGQATFTVKDTVAETTTYTATDTTDTLTITQTATVTFTSGTVSATQSTVSSSPGSVTADGSSTSTITVTAKDTFGNPVAGQSVSLGQGAGSSTITTVSGTTNGSGVATFTAKNSLAELVTYTATIGATGILQTADCRLHGRRPRPQHSRLSAPLRPPSPPTAARRRRSPSRSRIRTRPGLPARR